MNPMLVKVHADKTKCNRRFVLTREQVIEIFRIKESCANISIHSASALLAVQYGVSSKAIRDIWTGRSWLNVTYDLWNGSDRPERKTLGRPKGSKDSRPRHSKLKSNEPEVGRSSDNHQDLDNKAYLPSFNHFKAVTLDLSLPSCIPSSRLTPPSPSDSVLKLPLDEFAAEYASTLRKCPRNYAQQAFAHHFLASQPLLSIDLLLNKQTQNPSWPHALWPPSPRLPWTAADSGRFGRPGPQLPPITV